MPVKVSHTIDLGPKLPNEVVDIARKQGEEPDRVCADIQELREMIFGKHCLSFFLYFRYNLCIFYLNKSLLSNSIVFASAERGICVPPRTDDEFLIRFLRARFFKLEAAYNLVGVIYIHIKSLINKNFELQENLINYLFSLFIQLCRYCEFRDSNPELHVDVHPFLLTKLGEDDIVSVTPYRDQNGRRIMIYRFGNWRPSKIPVDDIFRASLILFEMGALEPQSQVLGGVGMYQKTHFFT